MDYNLATTATGRFAHATTDGLMTLCGQAVQGIVRRPDGRPYSNVRPDCRSCRVKVGDLRNARR